MNSIRLVPFGLMTRTPPREILLDPETGAFVPGKPYDETDPGQAGFGDVRRTGLRGSRIRRVALFSNGTSPILQIDSQQYDLNDTTLTITRQRILPMLKRFQILRQNTPVESFWYWWSDWYQQPLSHVLDIFLFVVTHLASPIQCDRFVRFWNSTAKGEPPWMNSLEDLKSPPNC